MSSSSKPVKVLCVGDVNGRFKELIRRLQAVTAKSGPFDMLLCVGEFFGPDAAENQKVTTGETQFPISTYVLGPSCPPTCAYYPEDSAEFSPNLIYLGRKGVLETAFGLTIGYMSGMEQIGSGELKPYEFSDKTVDDMLLPVRAQSGFRGIDILLTSMWPGQVEKFSSNTPSRPTEGSLMISRLASGLKPRYHFAGRGIHYERSPYRNHRVLIEAAQHTTRFIGLAAVGNSEKAKWMYAMSITPMRKLTRDELTAQPANASEFPYMDILHQYYEKKRLEDVARPENQFFFDMTADPDEEDPVDRGGRKRRNFDEDEARAPKQPIPSDNCWFCLANVGTEKHLIVSVGDEAYAAMPKGPLCEDHVMIMSINHVQSLTAASDKLREEVFKYRDAFALMADSQGKVLVAFERNYKCSHLQIQLIPVPKAKSRALKMSFLEAAQEKGIEMQQIEKDKQVWDIVYEGNPYFFVEFPDGSRFLTRKMNRFPIQFGREVLAGVDLLNCEDKVDWKHCVLGKEKETEMTNQLKSRFKQFDISADSDSDDE